MLAVYTEGKAVGSVQKKAETVNQPVCRQRHVKNKDFIFFENNIKRMMRMWFYSKTAINQHFFFTMDITYKLIRKKKNLNF